MHSMTLVKSQRAGSCYLNPRDWWCRLLRAAGRLQSIWLDISIQLDLGTQLDISIQFDLGTQLDIGRQLDIDIQLGRTG